MGGLATTEQVGEEYKRETNRDVQLEGMEGLKGDRGLETLRLDHGPQAAPKNLGNGRFLALNSNVPRHGRFVLWPNFKPITVVIRIYRLEFAKVRRRLF